jgi:hypothetical protein
MKKNRVIIYVEGGVVQSVNVDNIKNLEVMLFDVDNLKAEGKTDKEICKTWSKLSDGTNVVLV